MVLEGILSTAADFPHVLTLFAENNLPPRTYEFTLTSRYQAAEGGDIIRLRWRYEDDTLTPFPSGYLSVYATGDPIHVINVDVAGDGTVTLEDVRAALEGDLAITNLVSIPILGTGDTGTVIDVADVAAPPAGEFIFDKEYQRELHLISNVALQAFFNINPPTAPYPFPNQLKDGDTLGIYYPYIKDPEAFFGPHADPTKVGGRRQATLTNNALAAVVETDSSQLFNSTYEPEKVAQGIPICKRIGDDLIFIDGTIVKGELDPLDPLYPPDGVRFGEHGYTLERIMLGASSIMVTLTEDWFGAVPLSSGSPASIQDVINAILKDLAGTGSPEGSELIGSQGNAGGGVSALITSLVAGSLWGQLIALQAGQNARAALGFDETVTGEWLFDAETTFGSYGHQITGSWRKLFPVAPPNWNLFYRFNYDTAAATDVLWTTASWYVFAGGILMVQGCRPTTLATFVAAPDDVGTGDCQAWWFVDGQVEVSRRAGLAAGAPFQFDMPTLTVSILAQDALTGDWGVGLGGAITLWDDGVHGCSGARIVGKSSEDAISSGELKRLFESSSTSGQSGVYMYYSDRALPDAGYSGMGSVLITAMNCRYIGGLSGWVQNNAGAPSQITVHSAYGIRQYYKAAGAAGPWGSGSNPFDGWPDYAEVVPCVHPTYGGTGDFNMWSAPFFFKQQINAVAGAIVLQSGVDWRGRRALASLTVSTDSNFLNTSPEAAVQSAIEEIYACTRHVYFGSTGEAHHYPFYRITPSGAPHPLEVDLTARVTLGVNTATGDLELTTGSTPLLYVMGTVIPTMHY